MSPFHLFHLSLIGQHWWVLLFACWGFVLLLFVLLFLIVDQSLRSSCLPMTILAQLRDCHSCYDERSIEQKKKRGVFGVLQNQLWQLPQPAPPLEFPGEQGMFNDMCAQVREEEQVISLQFTRSQQDVSKRRRKKRKQVDDGTALCSLFSPCFTFHSIGQGRGVFNVFGCCFGFCFLFLFFG